MALNKVYLAIDLGASSGRVMAGVFDGRKLTLDEVHRFPNPGHPVHDNCYWDILALFAEIKIGLAKAAQKHGRALVSAGVDTWGVDYAFIDKRGELLGLPHQYRDPRTSGMEAAACRRLPRRAIYDITGIQFMFFNTLLQVVSEVTSKAPALAAANRLLFVPDLLNYWLTGRAANEYTIASTSQMLDARKRAWSKPLLKAMGIPTGILRDVVQPGTVLGELLSSIREETGIRKLAIVAPGCHDTASAVAAVPAAGTDHVYLSSGTWSLMGVEADQPVITDKSYEYNFTNEGGVGGKIRLLKNICGLWLVQETRRIWEKQGRPLSFADMTALAQAARPFAAVIDPDAADFATPGDMPARIRAFCQRTGQKPPATPGSVVRTILESLALRYRNVFEKLQDLTARQYGVLHIVGGGTQEKLLNQFAANSLQRPVVAGPVEATAIGNILLQMMAHKTIKSLDQGRALVRDSFGTATYQPADAEAWNAAYARFLKIEGK